MSGRWLYANVVYLGKGSYTRGKKFKANRSEKVDDHAIVDYLRGLPCFAVEDVFETEKSKPLLPEPEKKFEPFKKKAKVKRVKRRE